MAIHPSRFSGRSQSNKSASRPASRGPASKWWRLVLCLWLLLATGLIVWVGWSILRGLPNLPNQKPYPISTNVKERTNLLLASLEEGEPSFIAVLSVDRFSQTKWIPVDPTLSVNLPAGRGVYRLAGAWKLGQLEGESGMNLLRDSVSRAFGVPIDGYLAIKASDWPGLSARYGQSPEQIASKLKSAFFWIQFATSPWPNVLNSSFSALQLVDVIRQIRSRGEIASLSMEGTTLPSSQGGMTIDPASFDGRVGKEFQEDEITRSRPRVRIINASSLVGAAVQLARYVRNLGGEVISVESSDSVKLSVIKDHLGGNQLSSRLAPLIKARVFSDHLTTRADIEVTIGEDSKDWF